MEMFRFTGPCTRRDYAELWLAAVIIGGLIASACASGWLMLPDDRCYLLSVEYLPVILQVMAPLSAVGWALTASSIRRSRDARLPVSAPILALVFYLLAVTAVGITHSGMALYLLKGMLVLAACLLGLIFSGLFLLDDFGLDPERADREVSARPHGEALFGRVKAAKLMAEWHRRAVRPRG